VSARAPPILHDDGFHHVDDGGGEWSGGSHDGRRLRWHRDISRDGREAGEAHVVDPGGIGTGDKGGREIGDGGGVGAQTRGGDQAEMLLPPTAGSDIGRASVWHGKLEIPSSERGVYRRL
jgi:hypothetical protein